MKKLLIIPMLFACYMVMGQNAKQIIGKPIKVGKIEVAENDLPDRWFWEDAKKKCSNLGLGWRLPTKDELNTIYQKRFDIGGTGLWSYWSSTEFPAYEGDASPDLAWYHQFVYGTQKYTYKSRIQGACRCVRTL